MACTLKLPVGIDSFEKIRRNKFYYIDKTKLIEQLVETGGEVTLFTRPRRFGKTLNMRMLKAFFETGADESLFDGLYIAQNKALCEEHMGKYPVIFLSLKSVEGLKYEDARYRITELIGIEAERFGFLEDSEYLSENEKKRYKAIIALKDGTNAMDEKVLVSSLQILSQLLYKHFGQKTVILIDEYDVPLEDAYFSGYYDEMVRFIRSLFESALKTNSALEFSVITGWLRISKESIFTGLNNLAVNSILSNKYSESFGFVQYEVDELMKYYNIEEKSQLMKKWYDGYLFGNREIYNPWSVANYFNNECKPRPFWTNTSDNEIIREIMRTLTPEIADDLILLMQGKHVQTSLNMDVIYPRITDGADSIFSFLLMAGYLKPVKEAIETEIGTFMELALPNKEIRRVYNSEILFWLKNTLDGNVME